MAKRASRRKSKSQANGARDKHTRIPVEMLVDTVVASALDRDGRPGAPAPHLVDALAQRGTAGLSALRTAALAGVATAWERHWEPVDIVRAITRVRSAAHASVVAAAVVHQLRQYPDDAVPDRWRAQVEAWRGPSEADSTDSADNMSPAEGGNGADGAGPVWLLGAASSDGARRPVAEAHDPRAWAQAVEVVAFLRCLPDLPCIGPRPGAGANDSSAATADCSGRSPGAGSTVDASVLHRVTSLLAKAESTTYPEEAEALTGKAQELMTRHAIDRAVVEARRRSDRDHPPEAGARRLGVDDPYAGAKALLLQSVAEANRCRSVWTRTFGFATVFGDAADLDAVELLFTSLLVQSARAMLAASAPGARDAASTRRFRQSFLVSFATRIGDRLAEAVESAVAEAADRDGTTSAEVLPVLAGRDEAAERASHAAYPSTRFSRTSAKDAAGWQAGRVAADRAQLDLHDTIGSGYEHDLGAGLRAAGAAGRG